MPDVLPSRPWRRAMTKVLALALVLPSTGCSSAPRHHEPRLAAQPTDHAAFGRSHQSCREQVAAGKRDRFDTDRGTSAGVGVAVGTGVAAATVAGTGTTMAGSALAGTAAAVTLLVVAPLAIWATSRYIRAGKEEEIQQAMSLCLAQNGYMVQGWELSPAR